MIEPLDQNTMNEWLPLFRKYLEFYQVKDIDDERNRLFFTRFGVDSEEGCVFVYKQHASIVAFATVYFTYVSSIVSKVAIMNDLYTAEKFRRQGIAGQLILHCAQYAKNKGAARLQWLTAPDNRGAKKLYQSMGAKHSNWDFFTLA